MEAFLLAAAVTASLIIIIFLFEIFLISGRRRHPDMPDFYGSLYAHRGLFSNDTPIAPENSAEAFRRAVDAGFGIELDVHISSDGGLFVFHDLNMRRMCSIDMNITSLTSKEIGQACLLGGEQNIPRFSDVLELVAGKVPLIIELKCEARVDPAPLCRAVSDMLGKYTGAFCIESFNPYVVQWFRKNAPSVFRGQLAERFFTRGKSKKDGAVRFALENLWLNVLGRPDFVAYNHNHRDALSFCIWRRVLRLPAACWTVRDAGTLELLRCRNDCDCIIFEGFVPKNEH